MKEIKQEVIKMYAKRSDCKGEGVLHIHTPVTYSAGLIVSSGNSVMGVAVGFLADYLVLRVVNSFSDVWGISSQRDKEYPVP